MIPPREPVSEVPRGQVVREPEPLVITEDFVFRPLPRLPASTIALAAHNSLYFQWALINLSQMILYAAVPALAVAGIMVATINAGTFPGSTLGIDHITLIVGGAFAVTLVPFMLFVSYILRILTIAKRTLAIEPLILRESQR